MIATVAPAPSSSAADAGPTNPIDINHFFDVSNKCTPAHQAFYKKAYEGAVAIANAARKWPMYGHAESDLYFGKNAVDDSKLVEEVPEIKHVTKAILQALAALHEKEIVHTDIKPDIILINCGDTKNRFSDIKLAGWGDIKHVDSVIEEHVIGATIFQNPEAMLNLI